MNIQDAIKHCQSNKLDGFKRKDRNGGYFLAGFVIRSFYTDEGKNYAINGESTVFFDEDLLADDYEIVPKLFINS